MVELSRSASLPAVGFLLLACFLVSDLDLVLIDSMARGYSPWPRDAMTFLHDREGASVLLLRPNRQPGRENDAELGRLLVHRLPEDLDRELGGLRWTESPIPFHNGQILETERVTWVSIHALERRALELLGLDTVPVETFSTAEGLDLYLGAVRQAAAELERLLDHPVSFVHPLPAVGSPFERERATWLLGGGAGFDLDSLLTLLPRPSQPTVALVASLDEGTRLLSTSTDASLAELARTYGLSLSGGLRSALGAGHQSATARGLATFLDRSANHLAELGLVVERLPLLWIPPSARSDGEGTSFLVGWNNVVLDVDSEGGALAEGFASGLAEGDRLATDAFAKAGYRLDLLPILRESVLANGGYRCASNHDRAPRAASEPSPSPL